MKRLWIGIVILALLLAGGYLIRTALISIHTPIALDLEQAAEAALREDWATALRLARVATDRWNRYHRFTAAFADHNPMDELDGLFAQLPVYAQQRENPHFSATCKQLSFLATAIAESHRLSWWNLL